MNCKHRPTRKSAAPSAQLWCPQCGSDRIGDDRCLACGSHRIELLVHEIDDLACRCEHCGSDQVAYVRAGRKATCSCECGWEKHWDRRLTWPASIDCPRCNRELPVRQRTAYRNHCRVCHRESEYSPRADTIRRAQLRLRRKHQEEGPSHEARFFRMAEWRPAPLSQAIEAALDTCPPMPWTWWEKRREYFAEPIAVLDLGPRVTNALEEGGIARVWELVHCTTEHLLSIANIGPRVMSAIVRATKRYVEGAPPAEQPLHFADPLARLYDCVA